MERGIAADEVAALWNSDYLPQIWFVDIPTLPQSPAAQAVAARDATDVPTALLAQLVDADAVLAEDKDLIGTGFAPERWLDASLALRDIASFQSGLASTNLGFALMMSGVSATADAAVRHPRIALLGWALAMSLIGLGWLRRWYPSRSWLSEAFTELGGVISAALETYTRAEELLRSWSLPQDALDADLVSVACLVARARTPVTPRVMEQATGLERERILGALSSPAFVRDGTGWTLGRRPAPLPCGQSAAAAPAA